MTVPAAVAPLLRAGQVVQCVDKCSIAGTPVTLLDGSVSVDRARVWRREASLVLHPDTPSALVYPRGQRVRVWREYVLPSGAVERVGLGLYRPVGHEREDGGAWVVSGRSLEYEVQRARYLAPRYLSGRSHVQQIAAQVVEAVPDATVVSTASRDRAHPSVVHQEDRWAAIDGSDESLARAIGAEVYTDGDGVFRVADLPSLTAAPDWSAAAGEAVESVRESVSEDDAVNVIVARGNRTDDDGPPPWGVWWDDNPSSPTYVGDAVNSLLSGAVSVEALDGTAWGQVGFGWSPRFLESPLLRTDAQCREAAYTLGQSRLGVLSSLSFTAVPVPWLEGGAVVQIQTARGVSRHMIESYTLGVGASAGSPMQCQTRAA